MYLLPQFLPLNVVVILDAPTGMSSDVWALVQPELAKLTKVSQVLFIISL